MQTAIQLPAALLFDSNRREYEVVVPASTAALWTRAIPSAVPCTVKFTPLLATPPTVTMTLPVDAPPGTRATLLVALRLVGAAVVPVNGTVLDSCPDPQLIPRTVIQAPKA